MRPCLELRKHLAKRLWTLSLDNGKPQNVLEQRRDIRVPLYKDGSGRSVENGLQGLEAERLKEAGGLS